MLVELSHVLIRYFPEIFLPSHSKDSPNHNKSEEVWSKARRYYSYRPVPYLDSISFEMGSFISVSWANKCQENILKLVPFPSQEPIVFTMSYWLRREESLLVWLHEVKLSKCRKLKSLFPPNE